MFSIGKMNIFIEKYKETMLENILNKNQLGSLVRKRHAYKLLTCSQYLD
jgi:hypothetical protein